MQCELYVGHSMPSQLEKRAPISDLAETRYAPSIIPQ